MNLIYSQNILNRFKFICIMVHRCSKIHDQNMQLVKLHKIKATSPLQNSSYLAVVDVFSPFADIVSSFIDIVSSDVYIVSFFVHIVPFFIDIVSSFVDIDSPVTDASSYFAVFFFLLFFIHLLLNEESNLAVCVAIFPILRAKDNLVSTF